MDSGGDLPRQRTRRGSARHVARLAASRGLDRLAPYEPLDPIGDSGDRLVLPNAHHCPPGRLESRDLLGIPLAISGDLRSPVVTILIWRFAVKGAAVPEAAVDKDGDLPTDEHDVRT